MITDTKSFRVSENAAGRTIPAKQGKEIPMVTALTADEKRLIQGDLLKCVDGRWSTRDDEPIPETLLVAGMFKALQCWREQKILDCIVEKENEPLPNPQELNAKIPEKDWEKGLDGQPRPPWQLVWGCYLLDPTKAGKFTFLNSTVGARIAWEKLFDRVQTMKFFRPNAAPIVKLGSMPMKTKMGQKLRPDFSIERWVILGGDDPTPALVEHKPDPNPPALKAVAPVTAAEEMNDALPSWA